MICLTGDIHHMSLRTNDQRFLADGKSEANVAYEYLRLVQKYGLKVTFYMTGKTFDEEWDSIRPIAKSKSIEIGGHTYNGIPQNSFARGLYKIIGITPPSHGKGYSSKSSQERDIRKMVEIVREKTGINIVSWRSHGFVFDKNTYSLLKEAGIKYISDEVSGIKKFPEKTKEGLISHSLNVIMDHDHLYHAHRDREFVEKARRRGYGADDFGNDSYTIGQWAEMVRNQVKEIENKKGVATILIHPICMYLADRLKTAEELLRFFSQYETVWAKEISFSKGKP